MRLIHGQQENAILEPIVCLSVANGALNVRRMISPHTTIQFNVIIYANGARCKQTLGNTLKIETIGNKSDIQS